jgi:peptidylprolyl isomerase
LSSRTTTLAVLIAAAVGAGACGDDKGSSSATPPAPPAAETATAPPQTTTTTAPTKPAAYDISKDRSIKPAIPKPTGDPPTELVVQDIVKGRGRAAKSGDDVTVDYVGVSYSTGQQFDASWDGGKPFPFSLGAQGVIRGWDEGVVGMKKGGRRLLVIPPDLAYGPAGQGTIAPNETLPFVIDMRKIG